MVGLCRHVYYFYFFRVFYATFLDSIFFCVSFPKEFIDIVIVQVSLISLKYIHSSYT